MSLKFSLSLCFFVSAAYCAPVVPNQNHQDSEIVQSLIREVRAAPEHLAQLINSGTTSAFLHKYSDADKDDGDEAGYEKRAQDENGKGYKHYDTYHNKGGDKYGYETKSAYGKLDSDGQQKDGISSKYEEYEQGSSGDRQQDSKAHNKPRKLKSRNGGAARAKDYDEAETKNTYKVIEDIEEDYGAGPDSGDLTNNNEYDEVDGQYNEDGDGEDHGGSAGLHNSEDGAPLEDYNDEDDGGSSAHYVSDGSSGNTYDEDDGEVESEHYTATDQDDYDY